MKKQVTLYAFLTLLAGCGGGGGSSNDGGGTQVSPPVTPVKPALASIDAAASLKKFLGTEQTGVELASNDGYLGTATLSVSLETGQPTPLIVNGVTQQAASVRVISLLRSDANGRLRYRNTWKLHLDAQMKPVGMAMGYADAGYKQCMSVSSQNDLPGTTNGSGIYFSGIQTSNYAQEFRAGKYAHYCDPGNTSASSVEWSIAAGSPNPYFCLTMPQATASAKTRMCIPVDSTGALNSSAWVRLYDTDGQVLVDYKNTALNKPVEQLSTAVDSKNYWYGAVWRPQDGYVYQTYEGTRFASQQACRDQTTINWQATWNASNIAWTCVNVISR
ncbi:hypothetical protein ACL9RI_08280 [Janthinobacterium sp. Mn2066]|uniref:hypothetical protein n=1 Tax=Janthinobacterium sp. Mn2066 TaxID=3395264 RepID=UPI003BDC5261